VVLYDTPTDAKPAAASAALSVLITAEPLGLNELRAVAPAARAWERAGHHPPRLFTPGELARSATAFPIEVLDMQQWHTVLHGADPLADLRPTPDRLALELERELKGRLLALREQGLAAADQPRRLVEAVAGSLPAVLVLLRAALRLYEADVPFDKLQALERLAAHTHFDPQVFLMAQRIRNGMAPPRGVAAQELFTAYLSRVEQIAEAVDQRLRQE
jgi:hypothetical protein